MPGMKNFAYVLSWPALVLFYILGAYAMINNSWWTAALLWGLATISAVIAGQTRPNKPSQTK